MSGFKEPADCYHNIEFGCKDGQITPNCPCYCRKEYYSITGVIKQNKIALIFAGYFGALIGLLYII